MLGRLSKLSLGTVSSFQGIVALNAGTLELATVDALDRGLVRFGAGAQALQLDLNGRYTNTVTGFDRGDVLDFRALDPSSAAVAYNPVTHVLTVSSGEKTGEAGGGERRGGGDAQGAGDRRERHSRLVGVRRDPFAESQEAQVHLVGVVEQGFQLAA